jgi:Ca2+-binding RTX toxin-like protein
VWEYFGVDTVERIDGGAGVNVLTGSIYGDTLDFSGTALLNIARIEGGTGNDTITGSAGNDVIAGGADGDILSGGAGNDTYEVSTGDTVTEAASAGTDTVVSDITWTLGSNLENLFLTGTGAINATGNADANLVCGNAADNTLTGAAGVDALEGGAGNDTLSDSAGTDNGYFNGGAGADTLTGDSGREFFLGGAGNDTTNAGSSADIIAFNKGDGQDTVSASTGQDKVLSLGGNLNYGALALRVVGSDLVLDTGASESLTFKSWYTGTTNKSMLTLQVIAEAMAGFNPTGGNALLDNKVESFNFQGLVNAFDSARAANPGLSSWALTSGLAQFQLSGSDTAALGGDLAYQYGLNGTLAGIGFNKAQDVLTSAQFGTQAQTLRPLATLQDGFAPLS